MAKYPAFPLWEFQEEDITKFEDQEAVLLAWEMGTGKSPAALERDRRIRLANEVNGKTLLIAPLGTHDKWAEWFRENTPLTVCVVDPKNRTKLLRTPAHVYIVHWEGLRLLPSLADIRWQHVIADECHKAKSRKAVQTKALKRIKCEFRTGLTGTPATNRPDDLWSILHWLKPKLFPSYTRFADTFVATETIYVKAGFDEQGRPRTREQKVVVGAKNEAELLRLIRPFYSRHLKLEQCCEHHPNGVMPWLPKKTYTKINVTLHPQQRKAYDEMAENMLAWIGEHENEPVAAPMVISQLTRLQQFALGYLEWIDKPNPDPEKPQGHYQMVDPSAKMDAVMDLISANPGAPLLIYSQWKAPLHLLQQRLIKKGITYARYTGDESKVVREKSKADFVSGAVQILLGTVGAGGVGVDGLQTRCCTVIFLDRTWSPADNLQAEDRLHRGGQEFPVQVIDIVARDTVDLGRHQRLEQKWDWIKKLLGDK